MPNPCRLQPLAVIKQVRKLNWIAEPELSLLSNVTFIIFIQVTFVFPGTAERSSAVQKLFCVC